jgi:hypothetical protein
MTFVNRLLSSLTKSRLLCIVGITLIVVIWTSSCTEDDDDRNLPALTTDEVTEITVNSARSGGNISSDGGASVTAKGVCWSTNPAPTIDDHKTNDGAGGAAFVSFLTGLEPNTTYYVRAYATNAHGTAYGIAYSFDTQIISITTNSITEIRGTSAKSGGKIIAISGLSITERGVCWDVNSAPTTAKSTLVNDEVGESFESVLTKLNPATNYYIRAYAITDGFGTFYGDEKAFTTTNASQEEVRLEKLKGMWNIESVVNDATTKTGEYPGMTVTFAGTFSEGGTYNYASDADSWPGVSSWKALDTWKFSPGSAGGVIVRQSDLTPIAITLSNSDKTLELKFNYSGPGFNNGRTQDVTGIWVYVFTRP